MRSSAVLGRDWTRSRNVFVLLRFRVEAAITELTWEMIGCRGTHSCAMLSGLRAGPHSALANSPPDDGDQMPRQHIVHSNCFHGSVWCRTLSLINNPLPSHGEARYSLRPRRNVAVSRLKAILDPARYRWCEIRLDSAASILPRLRAAPAHSFSLASPAGPVTLPNQASP